MNPTYLDHNATTPMDVRVFDVMRPYFLEHYGNPSSVDHIYGSTASHAVEKARAQVATSIGASPDEIIFTGSCTESDNLAILGAARSFDAPSHFITTQVEHPAVLQAFEQLEREGHFVTYLGVDSAAQIRLGELESAFRSDTRLVSIMGANNEVGSLQPLAEIGRICEQKEALFHSDMAQMPAYIPIDVRAHGLHLASFSAHKAYGPKGVGVLYIRKHRPRIKLRPLQWGGGHERGLRPGTLNTPLIVGTGEAFRIANEQMGDTRAHLQACRNAILSVLTREVDGIELNGHATDRLANNLSLSIEGIEPLALMRAAKDAVCFSASSACATHEVKTSHVLLAMFGDTARARSAFRLSPGRTTTIAEATAAATALSECVKLLRRMR